MLIAAGICVVGASVSEVLAPETMGRNLSETSPPHLQPPLPQQRSAREDDVVTAGAPRSHQIDTPPRCGSRATKGAIDYSTSTDAKPATSARIRKTNGTLSLKREGLTCRGGPTDTTYENR